MYYGNWDAFIGREYIGTRYSKVANLLTREYRKRKIEGDII